MVQDSGGSEDSHANGIPRVRSTSIKHHLLETSGKSAARIREEVKIPWDLGAEVFRGLPVSEATVSCCLSSLESRRARFPHVPLHGAVAVGEAGLEPHRRRLLLPGVLIIERLFTALGLSSVVYKEATVKRAVLDLLADPTSWARCG